MVLENNNNNATFRVRAMGKVRFKVGTTVRVISAFLQYSFFLFWFCPAHAHIDHQYAHAIHSLYMPFDCHSFIRQYRHPRPTVQWWELADKYCPDHLFKSSDYNAQKCKDTCASDAECKRASFWGSRCFWSFSPTCKEWKECKGCGLKTYEIKGLSIAPVVIFFGFRK